MKAKVVIPKGWKKLPAICTPRRGDLRFISYGDIAEWGSTGFQIDIKHRHGALLIRKIENKIR